MIPIPRPMGVFAFSYCRKYEHKEWKASSSQSLSHMMTQMTHTHQTYHRNYHILLQTLKSPHTHHHTLACTHQTLLSLRYWQVKWRSLWKHQSLKCLQEGMKSLQWRCQGCSHCFPLFLGYSHCYLLFLGYSHCYLLFLGYSHCYPLFLGYSHCYPSQSCHSCYHHSLAKVLGKWSLLGRSCILLRNILLKSNHCHHSHHHSSHQSCHHRS